MIYDVDYEKPALELTFDAITFPESYMQFFWEIFQGITAKHINSHIQTDLRGYL